MGSLGVSSFQQIAGAIFADAIGPLWLYYDEWPEAAKLLRESSIHDEYTANKLIDAARERGKNGVITLRPDLQAELDLAPWNMTEEVASHFVRKIRHTVCGPREEAGPVSLVRIYGNFQHVAFFRRYR